jgi:diketogulonate reductase-like aldo/keto reductase
MIPHPSARRRFGSTDREVAIIGQGTWNIDQSDRASAITALRRGLDLGLYHIDTAEMYGSGEAERVVAEAIAGRRDEVFLVSKVLPENASRAETLAACGRTLSRLRTDHLDCYLLHWRGQHPLGETIAALEQLRGQGDILAWGVSNFDIEDLEEAHELCGEGEGRLVCNQVLYHLGRRSIEHHVIPWCEAHGVAVVGYSPFGHGNFPRSDTSSGQVLARVAAAHGATPRQVALAFLVRRPSLFTIPKSADIIHVEENAGAADLQLTAAEIAQIAEAFPVGRPPRELPML